MDAGAVITILALLFFAFVALGVYVSVKVVGAAKRGVERTVTQARRTVEDTTLRARSYGQGGVTGELAQLRLALRTSMRATQEALHAGVAEDASLSESLALFHRLSAHGQELDAELKRLEREPDRATVASLLPGLRERTERITHSAESLRWAARDRAQKFAEDDLDVLSAQIDMEAGALRHWSAQEPDAAPAAEPSPWSAQASATPGGSADRSWAEPSGPSGLSEPSEPSEPSGLSAQESERSAPGQPQAITARDPRQQTAYPWQKSARPETTN
ncbi:hypothetical protein J7E88_24010 [Streptomyces sp. ISL-10]|uniref:hypothetical protein n=1 Tax=Streptomyces sp. ISL-10 TaxID=2819172 RepID=UPI001BED2C42|nr:hypothetical protein [Streptomyces sp. ISL-10]MBT2368306.1 hypothetical protein [Streptomyces sp. ISL-10]